MVSHSSVSIILTLGRIRTFNSFREASNFYSNELAYSQHFYQNCLRKRKTLSFTPSFRGTSARILPVKLFTDFKAEEQPVQSYRLEAPQDFTNRPASRRGHNPHLENTLLSPGKKPNKKLRTAVGCNVPSYKAKLCSSTDKPMK